MDDLISRQDALKALDEMSYKSPHESATSVVRKKHFGEILEKFIMQQPSAQQWIPCSERVDIPNHEVLMCDKRGEMIIGYLAYHDEQWIGESEMEFMYDPIAWMPLPETYREETES